MESPIIPEMCEAIKNKCALIWKSLGAHEDYVAEKVELTLRMEDCTLAIQMFDPKNQRKLMELLTSEEIEYLSKLFKHFWYY